MRILVIEDEKKIAGFLRRGLKEEGYAVDVAADGQEGQFLTVTETYDLIILDLNLPKMDGLTLCRNLREEKIKTPILMLTVRDSVKDKVLGLDSGADDYLTKPFVFEELVARVRALLRRQEGQAPAGLQVSDLTLDLVTHRVTRADRVIPLTAKEFALLEYFLRNVNLVLTRTMIAEHVWDINFDPLTNVIDVTVNHLRKKISGAACEELIETVRGRGYRLKG